MMKLARPISGLLVLALALPALAQVTDQDISDARREVNRLTDDSAELAEEVIAAYGRQNDLDQEIKNLRSSIDFARVKIKETEDRLEDVAVQLYMGSTSGSSLSMLFSVTDQAYPAGMEYLREVNGVDEGAVDELRVLRGELDHQTVRLGEVLDDQVALAADLEEKAGILLQNLEAAQKVYDDLVQKQADEEAERKRKAEEERKRREAAAAAAAAASNTGSSDSGGSEGSSGTTAPAPPPTTPPVPAGQGTCPVAGAVSFTDSWGEPRSGGRKHTGVDMIAARGTPLVAIYSGRVKRLSTSSLGGKSVYFTSDAGDVYYYAHMDGYGDIKAGQSVPAGYVLGYVGTTGNAPSWLPHLHLSYRPGGGANANPYPVVKKLCG